MTRKKSNGMLLFNHTLFPTKNRGVFIHSHPGARVGFCHVRQMQRSSTPEWTSYSKQRRYQSSVVTCTLQIPGGSGATDGGDGVVVTQETVDEQFDEAVFQAQRRARVQKKDSALRIRAHRPIWTYVIIVINISVLICQKMCMYWTGQGMASLIVSPSLQTLGAKVSTKILSGELWRLVTAAFLHVNAGHLLLNSYALCALGRATEILFGSPAFMGIYMGGAIGGNMFSVCASIQSARPSVGSSGGVFALMAAMCVHLERNRHAIGPIAPGNLRAVVIATIVNLVGGWFMPSVDGWAHFGGCVYGAVMASFLAPKVVLHRAQDGHVSFVEVRRMGGWASWVVWITAVTVSIAVAICLRIATM